MGLSPRIWGAGHAFMALHFTTPGIPLIYSGQEYDLDKRLRFFEKDSFPKTKGKTLELLKQLGQLKNTHPSLASGVAGGSYERLQTTKDHQVLAFQRVKNQDTLCLLLIWVTPTPNLPWITTRFEDGKSNVYLPPTSTICVLGSFGF